jgi:putative ABC transport system permease protein
MKFLKLFNILILRNIREEKFLTFLSIIGIALGIGLFTGVKVASDRAIASFESDIRGFNPQVNYEILDTSGIDFNEEIYRDVRNIENDSFPVLKTFGYVPQVKETIDIVGIYSVKALRFFNVSPDNFDVEKFYRELNGVIVTKKFADRHALKIGDIVKPLVYDREYPLKIVDVLDTDSLLTNMVIMDIGNFQEYFKKAGILTRIDIITDEKTAEEISTILPYNLRIEKKEVVFKNQKSLIASFRYNLQFVSLIAILVGIFLLYSTVFISVVKRRTEIGILRSLGTDKKTVILLFTVQGMLLGFIGSVFGILLGQIAAYFSVIAVEKTISTIYSTVPVTEYVITIQDAFIALTLGLVVSLFASIIPSYEAAKIKPNESSREGSFEGKYRGYHNIFLLAGTGCIFSGIGLSYVDYLYTPFEFPVLAYAGILLIIAGFAFVCPFYLSILLKIMRSPVERIFRAIGKITFGDMRGNIFRFSVAIMSVAISSALIIALLTLIFSLRSSLKGWINQYITADVYIKPDSCKSNYCFYPLSEEVSSIVKNYPEVAGVDKFRALQLEFFGKRIVAGFADIEVKRQYARKRYFEKGYDKILAEMESDEKVAGISEYLSIKYGIKKGDTIKLDTPHGSAEFTVNDIFSSYSTTSGFIYLDKKWLREYWGLDDATQVSVYVKDGVDVDEFIYNLNDRLSPNFSLEIMNNQELRQKIMNIFNSSFAITYAIELIAIIVSLIGVINTLLALVFERKREISIIRYLGGSWKQIQQNMILSAGIVGITGILLGMLLGPLMSIIFINVVNKISFGWEIHFKIPFIYLISITALLFCTTLLAGVLPSKVARKIDPKRFISFE